MVRKLPQSRHSVAGKFSYGFSTGDTFYTKQSPICDSTHAGAEALVDKCFPSP